MIDKADIDYTVRHMLQHAISQIEEIDEPAEAVETLCRVIEILDGNENLVIRYWKCENCCRPIETFTKSELAILKKLEIIKE